MMAPGSEDVPEEDFDVTWVTDKKMILGGEKLMDQLPKD